jgi:hypothetical protein
MLPRRERILWLAVAGLASFGAWRSGQNSSTGGVAAGDPSEPGGKSARRLSSGDIREDSDSGRSSSRSIPADGEALRDFTTRVLRDSDPIRRTSGFMRILDRSTPDNFHHINQAWKDLRFAGTYLPHEEVMMNFRAGELMGRRILTSRQGSPRDLSMMHALKPQYRGWVKSDSADARRWLDELPEGDFRKQMTLTYIGALADDNPTGSLDEIAGLPEEYHAAAGGAIVSQLRQSDSIDSASDFLAAQAAAGDAAAPLLQGMFDSLAGGTTDGNGELLSRLVEDHAGKPYVNAHWITRAAALRGERDEKTSEVLEWALRMEGVAKDIAPGSVLAATTALMPAGKLGEAEKWLAGQPESPAMETLRAVIEAREAEIAPEVPEPAPDQNR